MVIPNPSQSAVSEELVDLIADELGDAKVEAECSWKELARRIYTAMHAARPTPELGDLEELRTRLTDNARDMAAHGFPIYARPLNEAVTLLSEVAALRERVGKLDAAAEQAANAIYPLQGIIRHEFDGDGLFHWMRDPTSEEAQALMDATYAVEAARATLQDKQEK